MEAAEHLERAFLFIPGDVPWLVRGWTLNRALTCGRSPLEPFCSSLKQRRYEHGVAVCSPVWCGHRLRYSYLLKVCSTKAPSIPENTHLYMFSIAWLTFANVALLGAKSFLASRRMITTEYISSNASDALFGFGINAYRWAYMLRKQLPYYPNTLLQVNVIISDAFALNLYGRPFCKLEGNIAKTLDFILTDVLNIHLECHNIWIDCCASCTHNQCSRIFYPWSSTCSFILPSYSDENQKHWMTVSRTHSYPLPSPYT